MVAVPQAAVFQLVARPDQLAALALPVVAGQGLPALLVPVQQEQETPEVVPHL